MPINWKAQSPSSGARPSSKGGIDFAAGNQAKKVAPVKVAPPTVDQPRHDEPPKVEPPKKQGFFSQLKAGVNLFNKTRGDMIDSAIKGIKKVYGGDETGIAAGRNSVAGEEYMTPKDFQHIGATQKNIAHATEVAKAPPTEFEQYARGERQLTAKTISAVTGGLVTPQVEAPKTLGEKLMGYTGQALGTVYGLTKITGILSKAASSVPALASFVEAHPVISGYLKSISAFDAYGQLNPQLGNSAVKRLQQLGKDSAVGALFHFAGTTTIDVNGTKVPIPRPMKVSLPSATLLGYGSAKLDGASDEDAIASGITLGVLDAVSHVGGRNTHAITAERTEALLDRQAHATLGTKPGATKAEIDQAFAQKAAEAQNDSVEFGKLKNAHDYLSGRPLAPSTTAEPSTGVSSATPDQVAERLKTEPDVATNSALVRDEVGRLSKLETRSPQEEAKFQVLQDRLTSYQDSESRTAVNVPGPDGPLLKVDTIRYSDGRFAAKVEANPGSNNFAQPFSDTYATPKEAISAVLDQTKSFAASELAQSPDSADRSSLLYLQHAAEHPTILPGSELPKGTELPPPYSQAIQQAPEGGDLKDFVAQSVNSQTGQTTFYRIPKDQAEAIWSKIDDTGSGNSAGKVMRDGEKWHITAKNT